MVKLISTILIYVFLGIAIVWDIIAVFLDKRFTLSKVIAAASISHPFAPLSVGILMGHLFWPMKIASEQLYWKISLPILFILMAIFGAYDFICGIPNIFYPIVFLILGLFLGHFGWPQKII